MRDVMDELLQWWSQGHTVALATVVGTWKSAPRQPGASMLVGPDGEVVGSVSGGCVEGAVYEAAQQVITTGIPVLQRYGVSDETAESVGLTCGGILDVFIEPVSQQAYPQVGRIAAAIAAGEPLAVATVVEHPDPRRVGTRLLAGEAPERDREAEWQRAADAIRDDARGALASGTDELLEYGPDGERRGEGMRVFVAAYAPKPRMIVFGAIDFAAAVAEIGDFLGYAVTVCDARPVFATATRFPAAREVVVDWPHRYLRAQADAGLLDERTVVTVLTHDPKFDVPVLEVALRLRLAYVGAMGSRRTHEDRMARLREAGVSEEDLARLASPIGLDLGARTPQETAISIAAEIVAARWGATGERLRDTTGALHRERTTPTA